jgi:thiosulfate dehydrogenase [quinone] large subunit
MESIRELLGEPSAITTPRILEWARTSKSLSVVWTAMRIWIGVMWIQAGTSKLWGAENPSFLHNNGSGVAGFAGHGAAAYSWWGSFLHSFVVPNASWIAVMVAFTEFAIGIAFALGLFTRLAALTSLALLFTYIMSGTASVCGFYALFAIVVLATWRTSSWIGVDGLIRGYRQRNANKLALSDRIGSDLTLNAAIGATTESIEAAAAVAFAEKDGSASPTKNDAVSTL